MNTFRSIIKSRGLQVSLVVAALSAGAFAQVGHKGNPYRPTGANYTISARQDISASSPDGTLNGAQVNTNFEFSPSIGVSYTDGTKLVDFGIGNYGSKKNGYKSTALDVTYDTGVTANSAQARVMDFDISANATGFNSKKVTPMMIVFGDGGQRLGTFASQEVWQAMTPVAGKADFWDINIGRLLSLRGLQNETVTGFRLGAELKNQKSDPYLLDSVMNGQPAPEPATLAILGCGIAAVVRKRRATK